MYHGLEKTALNMNKKASLSDQSDYLSSRQPTSLEEKQLDLKTLKEKNRNLELCHVMKRASIFFGPEESPLTKWSRSIKRPKKDKIHYSKDYANFHSFCDQIGFSFKRLFFNKRCNKAQRLLSIKEVDNWNYTE